MHIAMIQFHPVSPIECWISGYPVGTLGAIRSKKSAITRFSDAQQTHAECEAAACVAVTVRNTGQVAGEEVVQASSAGR